MTTKRLKAVQIENCKLEIANRIGSDSAAAKHLVQGSMLSYEDSRAFGLEARGGIWNFQFAFFNFQFSILFPLPLCALLFALCSSGSAQTIADKTVASVTNGARATPDLIT